MVWLWIPGCVVLTDDDLREHDLAHAEAQSIDPDHKTYDDADTPIDAEPVALAEQTTCVQSEIGSVDDVDWYEVTDVSPGQTVEAWVENLDDARLEERMVPEGPGIVSEGPSLDETGPIMAVASGGTSLWFGVSSSAGGHYAFCFARAVTTEVEPNDEPGDPGVQKSALVRRASGDPQLLRATGTLESATDVDRYSIDPRIGTSYTFALDATSRVDSATLALTDIAGNELIRSLPDDPTVHWITDDDLNEFNLVVSGEGGAYSVWVAMEPL